MNLLEKISISPLIKNIYFEENYFSVFFQKRGDFTPFFEYYIGPCRNDELLYFNKVPKAISYSNIIFNKILEKKHNQIDSFFSFHYERYSNKESFLQFLSSELESRILTLNYLLQNKIFNNPQADLEIERKTLAKYLYALGWVKNEYRNLKSCVLQNSFNISLKNELQTVLECLNDRNLDLKKSNFDLQSIINQFKLTISNSFEEKLLVDYPLGITTQTCKKGKIRGDHKAAKVLMFILIGFKYYSNENGSKLFENISHKNIAQILINNLAMYKDRDVANFTREISNYSTFYNSNKEIKRYIEDLIPKIYKFC